MENRELKNHASKTDVGGKYLLEVKNLKKYFYISEEVGKSVDDVSFSVRKGEVVWLVGESGCGKSVTALSIMGLIPSPPGSVESGEILFHGKD